jgi:hypothetical protein
MPADWTITQGDTEPLFYEEFEYTNGEPANIEGATVEFIMRSLTAKEAQPLTGKVVLVDAAEGKLYFAPSAADTSVPGNYTANWKVTFVGGEVMTFPTKGYLWVQVQPNLTSSQAIQIVNLGELKEKLFVPANDRQHDDWFLGEIEAVRPLLEEQVGPILPQIYSERFDGGNNIINLLHAPTYGWGTDPVLNVLGVSEFRGPIEYPLSLVPNPVFGSIYSVEVNPQLGELTRRTAGGGVTAFMPGRNAVHVVYEAGQATVPPNVRRAAVETIRWWYETTQAVGAGARTRADESEGPGKPMVALPDSAMRMLQPSRRHPSIG